MKIFSIHGNSDSIHQERRHLGLGFKNWLEDYNPEHEAHPDPILKEAQKEERQQMYSYITERIGPCPIVLGHSLSLNTALISIPAMPAYTVPKSLK